MLQHHQGPPELPSSCASRKFPYYQDLLWNLRVQCCMYYSQEGSGEPYNFHGNTFCSQKIHVRKLRSRNLTFQWWNTVEIKWYVWNITIKLLVAIPTLMSPKRAVLPIERKSSHVCELVSHCAMDDHWNSKNNNKCSAQLGKQAAMWFFLFDFQFLIKMAST